jgi:predicted 3-demethylubiquinone-9 3-methyltransferase (glyoxalase superfamily)
MTVQTKIKPFLMFEGKAEEAMTFYVSLYPGSEITELVRHDSGSIMRATFTIGGQSILCTDSNRAPRLHFYACDVSFRLVRF